MNQGRNNQIKMIHIILISILTLTSSTIINPNQNSATTQTDSLHAEQSANPKNGRILNLDHIGCTMSRDDVDNLLTSGNIKGYIDYNQFWAIFDTLQAKYPQKIGSRITFGHTIHNNPIEGFYLGNEPNQKEKGFPKKNTIFITGLHHSREPLTVTMVVYLMLAILNEWGICGVENELLAAQWNDFFRVNMILFVPIVNVDSFLFIQNNWRGPNQKEVLMVRKNRNISPSCDIFTGGVDLNRNYDFKWGIDEAGSSSNPCQEDYRGAAPFSEAETQAIRNLVNTRPNIVTGVNMHTYGNAWIFPFNFVRDSQNDELKHFKPKFYNFYNNFVNEMNTLHLKADFGNSMGTIDYPTNGEAGDWLTGAKNILNLDVELGDLNKASDHFYPSSDLIPHICRYNYLIFQKFFFKHNIQLLLQNVTRNVKNGTVDFLIYNRSISSLIDFQVEIVPLFSPSPLVMPSKNKNVKIPNLNQGKNKTPNGSNQPITVYSQNSMAAIVYGSRKLQKDSENVSLNEKSGDTNNHKLSEIVDKNNISNESVNQKKELESQQETPATELSERNLVKTKKSSIPAVVSNVTQPQILYKISKTLQESQSSLNNALENKFSGTIPGFSFLRIRFKFPEVKSDVLKLEKFKMITTFSSGDSKEYIFYTMSTQKQKTGQA